MAKLRLDYLLSTAIAVFLTAGTTARAGLDTSDRIAAAIPMPEAADVKPLTAPDVAPKPMATPSAPAATAPDASKQLPNAFTAPPTSADQNVQQSAAAPADPVGEKIKDLLATKGDRFFGGKRERTAVDAFYSARNYAPMWVSDGVANERAKAATAYLGTVDSEGLDPAEYAIPSFKSATAPDQLADADLRMTATLLTYARHAQNGRVNPARTASDVAYTAEPVDLAD